MERKGGGNQDKKSAHFNSTAFIFYILNSSFFFKMAKINFLITNLYDGKLHGKKVELKASM